MKKTASLLATGIIAATMVGATPGTASADVGDYCSPESGFQSQTTIGNQASAAIVTHGKPITLAPGAGWTRSVTIDKVDQVSAEVNVSTGATVSADAIISKAEATVSASLKAAGSVTTSSSITETQTLKNSTSQNRQYVVFSGTTRFTGTFKKTYCNLSIRRVEASTGTWRSWTVQSTSNSVRCDLAAGSALGTAAQRRFCG